MGGDVGQQRFQQLAIKIVQPLVLAARQRASRQVAFAQMPSLTQLRLDHGPGENIARVHLPRDLAPAGRTGVRHRTLPKSAAIPFPTRRSLRMRWFRGRQSLVLAGLKGFTAAKARDSYVSLQAGG